MLAPGGICGAAGQILANFNMWTAYCLDIMCPAGLDSGRWPASISTSELLLQWESKQIYYKSQVPFNFARSVSYLHTHMTWEYNNDSLPPPHPHSMLVSVIVETKTGKWKYYTESKDQGLKVCHLTMSPATEVSVPSVEIDTKRSWQDTNFCEYSMPMLYWSKAGLLFNRSVVKS